MIIVLKHESLVLLKNNSLEKLDILSQPLFDLMDFCYFVQIQVQDIDWAQPPYSLVTHAYLGFLVPHFLYIPLMFIMFKCSGWVHNFPEIWLSKWLWKKKDYSFVMPAISELWIPLLRMALYLLIQLYDSVSVLGLVLDSWTCHNFELVWLIQKCKLYTNVCIFT